MMMRLFHRTSPQAAGMILESGFADGVEYVYFRGDTLEQYFISGFLLEITPLDDNEGA